VHPDILGHGHGLAAGLQAARVEWSRHPRAGARKEAVAIRRGLQPSCARRPTPGTWIRL